MNTHKETGIRQALVDLARSHGDLPATGGRNITGAATEPTGTEKNRHLANPTSRSFTRSWKRWLTAGLLLPATLAWQYFAGAIMPLEFPDVLLFLLNALFLPVSSGFILSHLLCNQVYRTGPETSKTKKIGFENVMFASVFAVAIASPHTQAWQTAKDAIGNIERIDHHSFPEAPTRKTLSPMLDSAQARIDSMNTLEEIAAANTDPDLVRTFAMLMSSGNEHQKASARRAERDGMLRPGDIRQYRLRIRGKDREQARE